MGRRAASRLVFIAVAALMVAGVGGESLEHEHEHEGRHSLFGHDGHEHEEHDHEHHGFHDHEHDPEHQHEHDPEHQHEDDPEHQHEHDPEHHHEHDPEHQHDPEHDGMMHPGALGHSDSPDDDNKACTAVQTQAALKATSDYVNCAILDYADFQALVHADMDILNDAAVCFKAKAEEVEGEITPGKKSEAELEQIQKEMQTMFSDCVQTAAKKAEDGEAAQDTADFLQKMLVTDCKICSCLPAYLIRMPNCEPWSRYHIVAMLLEDVCEYIGTATSLPLLPVEVPGTEREAGVDVVPTVQNEGEGEGDTPKAEAEVPADMEVKAAEPEERGSGGVVGEGEEGHEPHLPNTFGPCQQPGHVHADPNDPTSCQPPTTVEEEGFGSPEARPDDRRSSEEGGGGLVGLGMSVLGVVAVGGVVGFGGVWAWGKFQSGTRQPGVRYMAADIADHDLGTELGPFGRQYA